MTDNVRERTAPAAPRWPTGTLSKGRPAQRRPPWTALLGLLALAAVAGCDPLAPVRPLGTPAPLPTAPEPRRTPIALPTPTPPPPTAPPTATRAPADFLGRQRTHVIRVWDGESILVDDGLTVRYLGLQAPGAGALGRPLQPFGREAAERNAELVEGKEVELEQDVTDVDANGQLPRYVYVDGQFVNQELVEAGLANAAARPPDLKHQDELLEAQANARENRRGIWANAPTLTVTPLPVPTPRPAPAARPPVGAGATPGPSPSIAAAPFGTPAAGTTPRAAGTPRPGTTAGSSAPLATPGSAPAGATPPTPPTRPPAVPAPQPTTGPAPSAPGASTRVPQSIPRFGEDAPATPAAPGGPPAGRQP